jgi:predicted kinase
LIISEKYNKILWLVRDKWYTMSYMKSLSLARPLVLATVGLPGSGKSFFARQFSETFGAPVVSADRLRFVAGSETIAPLASYIMEELFKTQKTFIVDGLAATRTERVELRKAAKAKGYDVLLIWVQTDATTSQYRSMRRSKRREDDKYNSPLTSEEYDRQARRFYAPIASEPVVVVSGKHTYATQARIVLKKLVAPRAEDARARTIVGRPGHSINEEPDHNDGPTPRRNVLVR